MLKKHLLLKILFLVLCVSCKDSTMNPEVKNDITIEVYLPINRIKSLAGTELPNDVDKNRSPFWSMDPLEITYIRMDTLKNRLILAGPFDSDESDLPNEPFITNEEIIGFDFETNTLELTKEGGKKIYNLTPDFLMSTQFIITANRKPILNGYFLNVLSSSWVDTYQIEYVHQIKGYENLPITTEFIIRYNEFTNYELHTELPDLTKNKEFFEAFKNR